MHDVTPPEDQTAAFAQLAATLKAKARAKPEKSDKPGPRLRVIKESIKVESNDEATTHKLMSYKPLERELPFAPASLAKLDRLRKQAPHASHLLNDIELDIRFARKLHASHIPQQKLLLVGPPGCGKTFLARGIMQAITADYIMLSAAGASSAIDIAGQPASFRAADASLPVRAIGRSRIANPGVIVDEIDKTGTSDWNGCPKAALIPYTEVENARHMLDIFLQVHVDCSHVQWILTANEIWPLPEALRSRMTIHEVPRPGVECLDVIVKGFAADLAHRFGVKTATIPKVDDLLRLKLEKEFKGGVDLRRLRTVYEREIKHSALNARKRGAPPTSPPPLKAVD